MSEWQFDPITAVLTALVLPLLYFLRNIILRQFKEWGRYLTEGVLYWVGRSIKRSLAAALTLKHYCRLKLADQRYMYLIVPSTVDISLEIDKVFVPLTLEHPTSEKLGFTHEDLLTVGSRIRVIGDPGSGKSSLVKRLLRDGCAKAIGSPGRSRLPVVVELRNLVPPSDIPTEELGGWLLKHLGKEAEQTAAYQMKECFDSYAATLGLIVLLDGLDEVSSALYPRVRQAINGLSKRLSELSPNNSVVLTMRTQFHQQVRDDFRTTFPNATFLRPFTPTDIYEFLTRWPFKRNARHNVARIYKELTDRPTLRELCGNPLILSMYVAKDQATGHAIPPDSRSEFYRNVTDELIIRRRLQQLGPGVAPAKLKEQRERILGQLALDHLLDSTRPVNSLLWEDAVRTVEAVLGCRGAEAETYLDELAKETGLVAEERPRETLRFIHLTFCEFLAAYEAIQGREQGWNALLDGHKAFRDASERQLHSRLVEVLPFACGLMARVKRADAVSDVANLRDGGLLARCFLETKGYDHPTWPEFVKSASASLLGTPEHEWNQEWLRDLHLFSVVLRDAEQCAAHMRIRESGVELESFFRSLIAKQKESLSTLLRAYAAQDAAAAFRLAEVCNLDLAQHFPEIIISHCDQVPFFALICEEIGRDRRRMQLWASLLCEAALRSRAVANLMHDTEPWRELSSYIESIPRERKWFVKRQLPTVLSYSIRESFYTQCVTIASAAPETKDGALPLTSLLRQVPTPGSMRRRFNIPLILFLLILGLGAALMRHKEVAPDLETYLLAPLFFISQLFLIGILYFELFRSRGLRYAYRAILNLDPALTFIFPRELERFLMNRISMLILEREFREAAESMLRVRGEALWPRFRP